ncbi:HDOD domain-containing protein [Granulosicoccus antarcticus]|uniref:HDOD domain-containing protein n=1 Tax=Granulosicoccus antarcticus IMCC3135 TaxID=1192854 RepID=A0A2Z2NRA4_9GAMM|nr:HDOD domain-containing protein [Granulosicoccus antarcticus]ASJ73025.1 hypothetical protein IMCC3135_14700 [Granulosicoccus antarcticus IMCC3135]
MTKILLVDSDISACRELARTLGQMRADWSINSTSSGKQALDIIFNESGDAPVDVIVTEAQLEDMSGFQLLDLARSATVPPVRFTLTADAGFESALGNLRVNQRFLLKPFDSGSLATSIERSLRLRESMNNEALKRLMLSVTSIPALPIVYDKMVQELASQHSSLMRVGEIVESDTGLTLTVLKVVNSAFYGINKHVESVAQAVTLLGAHMIKNITLTTKVFSRFDGSQLSTTRLMQLNNEAIRIGALCNQFARYAKLPRGAVDHCQISGMMANVGQLVATTNAELNNDNGSSSTLSPEIIGANVLRGWHMSDAVVEAVALQFESPPRDLDVITPLMVLHSIRYLQTNLTDTTDEKQRQACEQYLGEFLSPDIMKTWIDAFNAIEQLTEAQRSNAA